jgi:tail assembly chaperone E/41/14-like protein
MSDEAAKNGTEVKAAPSDGNIIPLREPVKFGEETITQLEYRKPTGRDIVECGHPLKFDFAADPPQITLDERKMAAMMSALYRQPPSVISRLAPNDWTTAAWALAGFFTPDLTKV